MVTYLRTMHVQNVLRELKVQSSPRSSSARLTAFPPMILLLPLLATLVVCSNGLGSLACDLSQNSPMLSEKPLCSWAKMRKIILFLGSEGERTFWFL